MTDERVELRVVGRGDVPAAARVQPVGFVADLGAELERAVAMVVPLKAGGGTRLKVLDAFGAGVPVISTALGVEGLHAEPGRHYVQAETPSEFAAAVRRVVNDPALRKHLAHEAHDLVVNGFSWQRCMEPVVELILSRGRGA